MNLRDLSSSWVVFSDLAGTRPWCESTNQDQHEFLERSSASSGLFLFCIPRIGQHSWFDILIGKIKVEPTSQAKLIMVDDIRVHR